MLLMLFYGSGNLDEIRKCTKKQCVSKKTTMQVGLSVLDALHDPHIHLDIKPEIFVVGSVENQHRVVLLRLMPNQLHFENEGDFISNEVPLPASLKYGKDRHTTSSAVLKSSEKQNEEIHSFYSFNFAVFIY